jgi:Ca2+/H+ antiporter, TMEM165/GDT1 family
MGDPLSAFLVSLGTVTLAEMGDKTQLLAMAFATKYKAWKVLIGVFIATVFNHALAVALGTFISRNAVLSLWVQILAALAFIFFALWTIRGDKLDEEKKNKKARFGAIVTVAIAFFLAELGDKTQLATIALAAKFPLDPVFILMGTTLGMLIADALGIVIAVVLKKKIPEKIIKYIAAAAFAVFGFIGCYQVMNEALHWSPLVIWLSLAALAVVTGIAAFLLIRRSIRLEAEHKREKEEKHHHHDEHRQHDGHHHEEHHEKDCRSESHPIKKDAIDMDGD